MKTIAVRMYGKNDVRLERFDLPEIKDDEILAKVVTDSLCMSSYKAVIQGKEHKRVPDNVYECPVILGHEFCGEIVSVGAKWRERYKAGQRFVIQPALNYNGSLFAPGYSYQYIGGDAQYIIIPNEVMETDNLLKYESDCYFLGSLAEPLSCVIGAFNACYHTEKGRYNHIMGCKPGGKMLILAGCGPMGLGAIDYALHGLENPPELLVVTDVDEERLTHAKELYGNDKTRFVLGSDRDEILSYSESGYDDVFVFAPVAELIELGDGLLCEDGCLNFFAGPTSKDFSSKFNFYNVHYSSTHVVGTSGGNRLDMIEAVRLMESGSLNPSAMVSHIGGIDAVAEATLNLPDIPGAKKLIYTGISLPLVRIADFDNLAKTDSRDSDLFNALSKICKNNGGLWCFEAEKYLIENARKIEV